MTLSQYRLSKIFGVSGDIEYIRRLLSMSLPKTNIDNRCAKITALPNAGTTIPHKTGGLAEQPHEPLWWNGSHHVEGIGRMGKCEYPKCLRGSFSSSPMTWPQGKKRLRNDAAGSERFPHFVIGLCGIFRVRMLQQEQKGTVQVDSAADSSKFLDRKSVV